MSARYFTRLAAAFSVAFAATVAYAANENAPAGGAEAAGDGVFQSAQVAVFYDLGDGIFRSIGVKKVTHPSTGVYCIKPSKKLITTKFVGVANVEWADSSGFNLIAFWNAGASGCPKAKRWFQVRTYEDDGTNWVLTDDAAWTFHLL